jgi:hypothetical protein
MGTTWSNISDFVFSSSNNKSKNVSIAFGPRYTLAGIDNGCIHRGNTL